MSLGMSSKAFQGGRGNWSQGALTTVMITLNPGKVDSLIFGKKTEFAIECVVTERAEEDWVFGSFLFWAHGACIGNPDDATDLKGCRHWLREFTEKPRERYHSALQGLGPIEMFARIHFPTMPGGDALPELDGFFRFNISHLGMSSFDRFDVLLVELPSTEQRLLWRQGDGEVQSVLLPVQCLQFAASECLRWMDGAF